MADLESKTPKQIFVQFTDGSEINVMDWWAEYIWLHLKNATDLIPLLYRSNGEYYEENLTIPISTLLQGDDSEPVTR